MKEVVVYCKDYCPYCTNAKQLLTSRGIPFKEIDLSENPDEMRALVQRTGMKTVPQVFFGDRLIGGYTELARLDKEVGAEGLLALLK